MNNHRLPFDLAAATKHLAERDECLKRLIAETLLSKWTRILCNLPTKSLLEAIAYQSISGKAAPPFTAASRPSSATGAPHSARNAQAPQARPSQGRSLRRKSPRYEKTLQQKTIESRAEAGVYRFLRRRFRPAAIAWPCGLWGADFCWWLC